MFKGHLVLVERGVRKETDNRKFSKVLDEIAGFLSKSSRVTHGMEFFIYCKKEGKNNIRGRRRKKLFSKLGASRRKTKGKISENLT